MKMMMIKIKCRRRVLTQKVSAPGTNLSFPAFSCVTQLKSLHLFVPPFLTWKMERLNWINSFQNGLRGIARTLSTHRGFWGNRWNSGVCFYQRTLPFKKSSLCIVVLVIAH